ncbi:efflux RND transporter permease subunit [Dyadobacter fanqingshengii]|uniref:Efflux RND transporter permease subunit n=1 Tax=Dyadobacter fanqingshengii TaxID=2906443 RepID=A0A9X1PAG8_9BACT|nr:efflux RND transporter permease subunit [Dyadobacter fanqingshengii]MCF0040952.1 efflux RND transporter permease subunit [Dyadobacter fanqingshengii]USJ37316.1 efflux RND transporter permease subunit [Dyadobacter fanqingshengii]
MKLPEFAVKNYQFTLVIFMAVLALGVYSLFTMPRSEDPDIHPPQFTVVIVYPGASPKDMEQLVVDPMEKKINELDDMKHVITDIRDGLAVMQVQYKYSSDPDDKYQELVREINSLRNSLPADINDIRINKQIPSDVSIYQYALISENASYAQLKKYSKDFKERLEKIKSLKKVDYAGFPERQVNVSLNLEKIAQQKLTQNQIINALQSENVNIPGGSISMATKKLNIKTSGNYRTLDEVANTVVSTSGGKVVYLKDVADVKLGYEDETHITRLNGFRCSFVNVSQKEGENIIAVQDQVLPVVAKFEKELPANIELVKVFDQAKSVDHRLSHFARDFGIAILLVLLTLLPLGSRASVVVMISIPLSLSIGLTIMNLLGYNINQLSIVGMIVALGILVDDSIVVVENIERYLRLGYGRVEAAVKASSQIGMAVVGCTILLIFAFLPLVFLPEGAGDFIRSLPLSVITTVFASMLVSLTIVPFLSSILLKKHASAEGNFLLRGMKKGIHKTYGSLLDKALKWPATTLVLAGLIFAGSLALVPLIGNSLFPKSEKPMFLIDIETPQGTNLKKTNQVTRYVEGILKKEPLITSFATNVGKGNPRVYYNVIQRNESENFAEIFVQVEGLETEEKVEVIERLRKKLERYPGAEIKVKDFEQGPLIEAPLAYRVYGENLDDLRKTAFRVADMLSKTEGTIYVNNPLQVQPTDLKVNINKQKAGTLGISSADIDRTVRLGAAGLNVATYREDVGKADNYNVNVSVSRNAAVQDYGVFDKLYVTSASGANIPLKNVATIEFESSPNQIRHYDKDRYVTVSSFAKPGYNVQRMNEDITAKLGQFKFEKGQTFTVAGEKESQEESFGGLGLIILVTIFGFLGVLILEFKTFKSILIVLSVIPLGIVGGLAMLFLTGETLSFTATIGFIALVGIEVKNSLLVVDFTNQLRAQGMGIEEAIIEAGEIRFVPILLTSMTAIGGLLPLVIEYSALYSPLALVLIGGLISSTLLSRLVTPVMYKLLPPSIEHVAKEEAVLEPQF